jgi:histidinol dehydrogenase
MMPYFESARDFLAERARSGRGEDRGRPEIERRVEEILARVRREGDRALVALAAELDGVRLEPVNIRLHPEPLRTLAERAPPELRRLVSRAAANVRAFHERQRELSWSVELPDGTVLGQKVTPLDAVGLYVPGGKTAYPSTVLMSAIPAQIAGVSRLVVATPPGSLERGPAVAAALAELGLSEVYQVGGAQAIAALAYGTETVPRVDKIVGPGNAYVTTAKRMVYGAVGIESLAGPSEIVVLADASANPRYVAADLLSQAEHGSGDERAVLVTPSSDLVRQVQEEIGAQIGSLPRARDVEAVLRKQGAAVLVEDLAEAVALVDRLAPEHLEILAVNAEQLAGEVRHAGAIFIGESSPVTVGDYYAGPSHVLPTGTTARFASPLGVYDFLKRSSLIRYSRERLERQRRDIEAFARAEDFEAHARAVAVRFEG